MFLSLQSPYLKFYTWYLKILYLKLKTWYKVEIVTSETRFKLMTTDNAID